MKQKTLPNSSLNHSIKKGIFEETEPKFCWEKNPPQLLSQLLQAWMISLQEYADPSYGKSEKRIPPWITPTKHNPKSKISTRKMFLHYSGWCKMETRNCKLIFMWQLKNIFYSNIYENFGVFLFLSLSQHYISLKTLHLLHIVSSSWTWFSINTSLSNRQQ